MGDRTQQQRFCEKYGDRAEDPSAASLRSAATKKLPFKPSS